jgi:hypothetical protein
MEPTNPLFQWISEQNPILMIILTLTYYVLFLWLLDITTLSKVALMKARSKRMHDNQAILHRWIADSEAPLNNRDFVEWWIYQRPPAAKKQHR